MKQCLVPETSGRQVNHRLHSKRVGLTLLETLLALAIFVGSAALLSRLVLLGVENAKYSELQTRALLLAQSQLAELEAGILPFEEIGPYPAEEDPDWQWTISAESSGTPGLYLVHVLVENISGGLGDGYSLSLSRYFYDEGSSEEEGI